MARIRKNALLEGVSGAIGKNVVIRNTKRGGVMANMPKKRKKNSPLQEAQVSRFDLAIQHSVRARALPGLKELYGTGITDNMFSAHHVAVSDFLNAPEIHEIDVQHYHGNPGDLIRVRATDDFKVNSVKVTITNADGIVIETGDATPRGKKGLWRMATTGTHTDINGAVVTVVATDVAGNKTEAILTLATGELLILPDTNKEGAKKLSAPDIVRATAMALRGNVSSTVTAPVKVNKTIVGTVNQDLVEQGNNASIKQRGGSEFTDRAEPVEATKNKVQTQAIMDVLRSAFPDLQVELVSQMKAGGKRVTKSHLRIWLE